MNIVPVSDIQVMAQAVANSKLFGIKTPDEAMSLMLIAQAEGMHPAMAARDYHVIQGRPSLKADAMLARFQQAGGVVKWVSYTDAKVSAEFSHPVSSPKPVLIEWDMERARKAELSGKDNWKKYPRQMLRARTISEGVRTAHPGSTSGLYTPEEIQDMPPEKDMGSAERVEEGKPQTITEAQVSELTDLLNDAGISETELCKVGELDKMANMLPENFDGAKKWIAKQKAKRAKEAVAA